MLSPRNIKQGNIFSNEAFGDYGENDSLSGDSGELSAYSKFEWVAIAADCLARDSGNRKFWFEDKDGNEIELKYVPDEIKLPFTQNYANKSLSQNMANIVVHKSITGNAYLFKAKATGYGLYKEMTDTFVPLRPDCVKVVTKYSGLFLDSYEVNLSGDLRKFMPDEIIQFSQNAVMNPFIGMGNIEKARRMYETESKKESYSKNFYKNGAMPSMVVTDETDRTVDDIQRLQKLLGDKFGGVDNSGRIMYMAGKGINATALPLSRKDMQFIEEKTYNRQSILSLFGVPPIVAGIVENANRSNSDVQEMLYYKNTINPIIKDYEDTFNSVFINPINPGIFIRFEKHNTGDIDSVIKKLQAGIITPNMAAEALGEPISDDDGMDDYYMPANYTAMGMTDTETDTDVDPNADPAADQGAEQDPENETETETETEKSVKKKQNVPRLTICGCGIDHKDLNDPHNFEIIAKKFDERRHDAKKFQSVYLRESLRSRSKTEDDYVQNVEKFFIRQKNRILVNFEQKRQSIENRLKDAQANAGTLEKSLQIKALNDIGDELMDDNIEDADFRTAIRPLHTSAIQKSISNNNKLTGGTVNPNLSNLAVSSAIASLGLALLNGRTKDGAVIDVNQTTKDSLDWLIGKAVKEGWTIETLQSEIDDKLALDSVNRARRIARTESRKAYDQGSKIAYKELGVQYVDVVGCTNFEPDSDCGKQNVPVNTPLDFHPNHIGCIVPSEQL
jgi:HK97 family phage portal protein